MAKPLIRSMREADVRTSAALACDSEIGARYGFVLEVLSGKLLEALGTRDELFVAEIEGSVLGFAWVDPRGAFSSAPYLRLIVVASSARGFGIGEALLAEFEARTAKVGRDYCLLVSDFNEKAQTFYERHGYRRVGSLADFAKKGIDEVIMVKPRGSDAP